MDLYDLKQLATRNNSAVLVVGDKKFSFDLPVFVGVIESMMYLESHNKNYRVKQYETILDALDLLKDHVLKEI
jgi:hypothetical protein